MPPPDGTLPTMNPQMTAAERFSANLDAASEQQSRIRDPRPSGDVWGGAQARRFRFDPLRVMDANLQIIASYLQPDDVLVDVGGGAGRVCLPLALRCREVINVDCSPGMGTEFTASAAEASIKNARLIQEDWLQAEGVQGDMVFTADVIYFVRDIVEFVRRLEAAARRRVIIAIWSEPPPYRNAELFRLIYGEDQAPVSGQPELLAALWEMGILPDVRVLPEIPWWEVEFPKTKDASIQKVLDGSWLDPADHERARNAIESRFDDLFAASPAGYRPLWRKPMREVLVTWEPGTAVDA